ncbi:cytochrome P450 6a2-like [Ischnura elegans]|uniref:cytochrome P450 6a2-like n=1 Tax=Ischnura elegans TaxID=197161 RepID=UPI001ED88EC4|nr:cytochrome P450 6a2-like [Ischnura elegans]
MPTIPPTLSRAVTQTKADSSARKKIRPAGRLLLVLEVHRRVRAPLCVDAHPAVYLPPQRLSLSGRVSAPQELKRSYGQRKETSIMIISLATLLWLAISASILFIIVYMICTWNYGYWKKRGIPTLDPTFPWGNFGPLIMQKRSTVDYFIDLYNHFEEHPLAGYISVWEPTLLVRDPALIKKMMVKDFSHFQDRGMIVDEKNDPLSAHLFNLAGKRWHFLRTKLSPTFTSGKMQYMFPLVRKCSEDFHEVISAEILKNGNEIEVRDLNARYTTDVIGSTAFGVEVGSLFDPDAEMRVIGRKIFGISPLAAFKNFIFFFVPRVASIFKVKVTDPFVEKYFTKLVSETIAYRQKNDIQRNDFLQLLITLRKNFEEESSGKAITPDEELNVNQLCAQAFVFFLGGFETSATTMTFCLYELARNPDIQDKLAEEVEKVLEKHNGELTYESLAEMQYMDRVIAETLRLYPPVPVLFRECTKEYVIEKDEYPDPSIDKDIVIEKGTKVVIPVVGMHYDSNYFSDPGKFNPDRFTEEEKSQRPQFTYLPFGEGPRICIGMRFGNMQTKSGLAALISHFVIRPSEKNSDPIILDAKSFVPAVKEGVYLKFFPRKNHN